MSRIRIGLAGLGYWGPNLARNFDELAELAWLCDSPRRTGHGSPRATPARASPPTSTSCSPIPELDAVVVATPVVTHYDLARRALLAGKHVFVEKPMAMRASEAEELVALAEERELVLMPGHLLLYHPGVRKLKELVDAGELGDVLYLYGNRQNFGKIRREENALSSLGAHDLSVILHLVGEEPIECWARGETFLGEVEDVVFCYLRFPSGKVAHMHLSWLDPHKMRKMTVVGDRSGWSCSTTWSSSARSRSTTRPPSGRPRATASGGRARATSTARRSRTTSRCASRCSTSSTS